MSSLEAKRKAVAGMSVEKRMTLIKERRERMNLPPLQQQVLMSYAGELKIALQPDVLRIVNDEGKTIKKMSELLGVAERTVGYYRTVLIIAGFATRREPSVEDAYFRRFENKEVWNQVYERLRVLGHEATMTEAVEFAYKDLPSRLSDIPPQFRTHIKKLEKFGEVRFFSLDSGDTVFGRGGVLAVYKPGTDTKAKYAFMPDVEDQLKKVVRVFGDSMNDRIELKAALHFVRNFDGTAFPKEVADSIRGVALSRMAGWKGNGPSLAL